MMPCLYVDACTKMMHVLYQLCRHVWSGRSREICSLVVTRALVVLEVLGSTPYGSESLLQNRPLFLAICPGSLWARDNRWLLSRVQRLAGPAGGQGPFVPVGGTNRDKRVAFCPCWCLQPGQNFLAPLSPSLSPRPSHSAHLFHAVLGSGGRSSCSFLHHICEDL